MTPEDVAAIRADIAGLTKVTLAFKARLLALCDALEAAWAARDERTTLWAEAVGHGEIIAANYRRERAERAEAEAERDEFRQVMLSMAAQRDRAEAALSAANHSIECANEDYNRVVAELAAERQEHAEQAEARTERRWSEIHPCTKGYPCTHETTLARVRDLCDYNERLHYVDVLIDDVLAAIEGDHQ